MTDIKPTFPDLEKVLTPWLDLAAPYKVGEVYVIKAVVEVKEEGYSVSHVQMVLDGVLGFNFTAGFICEHEWIEATAPAAQGDIVVKICQKCRALREVA